VRKALSRVADAAAVVAGRLVGAVVEGVISVIQGAAVGIRNGWHKEVSRSRAPGYGVGSRCRRWNSRSHQGNTRRMEHW
jgi:hypothetical protein